MRKAGIYTSLASIDAKESRGSGLSIVPQPPYHVHEDAPSFCMVYLFISSIMAAYSQRAKLTVPHLLPFCHSKSPCAFHYPILDFSFKKISASPPRWYALAKLQFRFIEKRVI